MSCLRGAESLRAPSDTQPAACFFKFHSTSFPTSRSTAFLAAFVQTPVFGLRTAQCWSPSSTPPGARLSWPSRTLSWSKGPLPRSGYRGCSIRATLCARKIPREVSPGTSLPQRSFNPARVEASGVAHYKRHFETPRVDVHGTYRASDVASASLSHASRRKVEALVDTGANRSFVGLHAARRIARAAGRKLLLTPSRRRFRFGVDTHGSIGSFFIRIPTPSGL